MIVRILPFDSSVWQLIRRPQYIITRRVLYELWIPQPGTIDKMFSSQPPHVQIRNERIYQLVRFLCISASFLLSLLGTKNPIPHHSMKYLLYCCDVYSCSEFRWVMTTALKLIIWWLSSGGGRRNSTPVIWKTVLALLSAGHSPNPLISILRTTQLYKINFAWKFEEAIHILLHNTLKTEKIGRVKVIYFFLTNEWIFPLL